jgi:hypothetical protein
MTKRYKNALEIVNVGACNPSGVCFAIIEACQEMRAEPGHGGTDEICRDPAIRLMVSQLAFLVHNPEMPHEDYAAAIKSCEQTVEIEECQHELYAELVSKSEVNHDR